MRPLALWHGFTGRGTVWEAVREHLDFLAGAGAFDVWAPDLPGHGPTFDPPAAPPSFEATVDHLAAALDARFGRPAEVVGYSLGARLALGLAVRHPERIARLTLIGARAGLDASTRAERVAEDADRAARLLSEGVDAFVDRWRALPLFATQDRLPDEERAAHDRRRRSHTADGLAWAIDTLSPGRMADFRPSLARLDLPVDVLVGEDDARFLPLAHEITDQLSDGRLRIIAGAGHDVVLESPSAVAAVVSETRRPRGPATRRRPTRSQPTRGAA